MNLLIVDDNPDILEALSGGLAWEELGFAPPYLAQNAAQAKEIIKGGAVDILITDIEMPGESGLALFEWVREYDPEIPCIFLTSHASFSYCQQAMQNGGYDYILQPARFGDIESSLKKCRDGLAERRRDQVLLEKSREQSCYSLFAMGERFGDREEWIAGTGPGDGRTGYLPALFALPVKTDPRKTDLSYMRLAQLLAEARGEEGCVTARISAGVLGVVLFLNESDVPEEKIRQLDGIRRSVQRECGVQAALYAGACTKEELPRTAGRLTELKRDNVYEKEGCFSLNDPVRVTGRGGGEPASSRGQVELPDPRRWEGWILSGDGALVQNQIRNLIRHADAEGTLSLSYMKQLFHCYRDALSGACHETSVSWQELSAGDGGVGHSEDAYRQVETFEEYIGDTLRDFGRMQRATDEICAMTMEERIRTVADYMEHHLAEPLSRADMAGRVFLSEDYFARTFKSVTGFGFREYVMKCRMEHAKLLLTETAFPVGVIASKVGYDNFSNFAQAFKKYTGLPPKEYRRSGETEGAD